LNEYTKFVRASLNVDRSPQKLDKLHRDTRPEFQPETLFLKVLVEGDASLYQYFGEELRLFFYQYDDRPIEQLVYVMYKTEWGELGHYRQYQQQLWNALKCSEIKQSAIERLDYKKEDLLRIFLNFNQCKGGEFNNLVAKRPKRDFFHMAIRPGINFSSLRVNNPVTIGFDGQFENQTSFRLGVELEFFLPFNKDKWSFLVEPTYRYYYTLQEVNRFTTIDVNYASVEVPVGFRYYMFLNDQSALFLNSMVVMDFSTGELIVEGSSVEEINPAINFAFGGGFRYNNRWSTEFRYFTRRELFPINLPWASDYGNFSIILGYRFF
ncbi:MAG: tRNA modification GTPase, partial [Bacteroidota bacterium]